MWRGRLSSQQHVHTLCHHEESSCSLIYLITPLHGSLSLLLCCQMFLSFSTHSSSLLSSHLPLMTPLIWWFPPDMLIFLTLEPWHTPPLHPFVTLVGCVCSADLGQAPRIFGRGGEWGGGCAQITWPLHLVSNGSGSLLMAPWNFHHSWAR